MLPRMSSLIRRAMLPGALFLYSGLLGPWSGDLYLPSTHGSVDITEFLAARRGTVRHDDAARRGRTTRHDAARRSTTRYDDIAPSRGPTAQLAQDSLGLRTGWVLTSLDR